MLTQIGSPQLTHELLTTLIAEVTGIINSRPITAIPSEVDEPQPLGQSHLPLEISCQKTSMLEDTGEEFSTSQTSSGSAGKGNNSRTCNEDQNGENAYPI
jgi:hypothetical protein